jgi:hypothetical protein
MWTGGNQVAIGACQRWGIRRMTVSGLGSAYPRVPLTPTRRALRPEATERNDFDSLTGADRELIFHVTGQRIGPGFDPARETTTAFASTLAAERASGLLAPGQQVTGLHLKDLNRRFERAGGANPMAPYLDKALAYLSRSGPRRIDLTA